MTVWDKLLITRRHTEFRPNHHQTVPSTPLSLSRDVPVQHMQLIDEMSSKRPGGLRLYGQSSSRSIVWCTGELYCPVPNTSPRRLAAGKFVVRCRHAGNLRTDNILFMPACSDVWAQVHSFDNSHGWWYTCNCSSLWKLFLLDSPNFILLDCLHLLEDNLFTRTLVV